MSVCGQRLLIAEDEPLLRMSLSDALRKEGWCVDIASDGEQGFALFEKHHHEVVLADLVMPRVSGLDLLRRIKASQPDTTVLIMTAHGSVERAVEAMREGAADFVTKPFSIAQLLVRLDNVCSMRVLREQNVRLQEQLEDRFSFSNIIGKSKKMREIFDLIRQVADSDATVLIQGESGTGKEMVAAAVHFNSRRRTGPYVRVSCASLPESLVESELFGYEKGAFTGAAQRRIGRFEAATGGTLLLDEIGDLPLNFQVKLLRVLQERKIERLGSNRPIPVDVRIVAASLRPLEDEIAEGAFREDLYFRINTVMLHLPALRERREDIPLLAGAFLREMTKERGKTVEGFTEGALEVLVGHSWPGNVRELRNTIERAVLFCRGPRIAAEDLPAGLRGGSDRSSPQQPQASRDPVPLQQAVATAEIEAIRNALAATRGRRNDAAALLGITRKTLWEKIRNYGIEVETAGDDGSRT
jgi:DNA-binding NtrC family response regulator